jgi:hypothetical protein
MRTGGHWRGEGETELPLAEAGSPRTWVMQGRSSRGAISLHEAMPARGEQRGFIPCWITERLIVGDAHPARETSTKNTPKGCYG